MKDKTALLKFILKEYLLLIVSFTIFRFVFLFKTINNIDIRIPFSIYLKSFLIGLRFDSAIIGYFFILIILLVFIYLILKNSKIEKFLKYSINIFICLTAFLLFFVLTVDAEFYKTFNTHLNISINDYLSNMGEITGTIWIDYPVISDFLIVFLITGLFSYFTIKNFKKLEKVKTNFVFDTLNFLLLSAISVTAARGGIGKTPIDWGAAYFSEYTYANKLGLNGIFTFMRSYVLEKKETAKGKNFMPEKKAEEIVRNFLKDENSKYIESKNPLLRKTNTGKEKKDYNVVIILLESWMAEYIGVINKRDSLIQDEIDVTPRFNELSKEGLLFTKYFASGLRTNRGIVSTLVSFPSQTGKSIMKKLSGENSFVGFGTLLKERGYTTHFFYGGDLNFDNMRAFLLTNDFDNFISVDDFSSSERSGTWGVNDEVLFAKTAAVLDTLNQPFLASVMTLSNHEPFTVPENFENKYGEEVKNHRYLNAYNYSDYALGKFFDDIKKKDFYKNTVFVLTADHGRNRHKSSDLDWQRFHIPLLIIAPEEAITPGVSETTANQTDILPTVLSLLGGEFIHSSWGRNLLEQDSLNFSFFIQNQWLGGVSDNFILADNINIDKTGLYRLNDSYLKNDLSEIEPDRFKRMKNLVRAFLQVSSAQVRKISFGRE